MRNSFLTIQNFLSFKNIGKYILFDNIIIWITKVLNKITFTVVLVHVQDIFYDFLLLFVHCNLLNTNVLHVIHKT